MKILNCVFLVCAFLGCTLVANAQTHPPGTFGHTNTITPACLVGGTHWGQKTTYTNWTFTDTATQVVHHFNGSSWQIQGSPANCTGQLSAGFTASSTDGLGYTITTNGANATITYNAPLVTGYINPKYLIMGVTYAPPGPSSHVTYSNSTMVGTTSEVKDSFATNVSVTVSVQTDIKAWAIIGGAAVAINASESTDHTQTSNSSTTTTVSQKSTVSDQTNGTGNAFAPVNHDYDVIWLWLNPLVIFSVNPNSVNTITWNGYGYDSADLPGMDIYPVQVGYLNGHFGPNPSVAAVLARGWVTANEPTVSWPSGQGPGLTSADFTNILKADPFAAGYTLPSPLPLNSADGRFTQIPYPPNPVPYIQAGPGNGGGITTTYSLENVATTSSSQGASTELSQSYGLDTKFSGGTWFAKFSLDIKTSNKFTWMNSWQRTLTTSHTLTNALSITGPGCPQTSPPCVPAYAQSGQFIVFQDNLYGTFMFYPGN